MTTAPITPAELRDWLISRVAFYLDRSPDDIDAAQRLVEIGIDSIHALTLCGDVEERFGLPVETTLAWDHPTVNALTAFLHGELENT
jgi:acyl carrier protein